MTRRERRQPDDHQDQRTLQQDSGGERRPENERVAPCNITAGRLRPRYARAMHTHRGDEHISSTASVLARRASTLSSTQLAIIRPARKAAAPRYKSQCGPIGEQYRADGAQ